MNRCWCPGFRWSIALVLGCGPAACTPTVVEYHQKPEFYGNMAHADFKDGVTADGAEIRWVEPKRVRSENFDDVLGTGTFRAREVGEDGRIILRARQPQQLLANTLKCLQDGEYQLLWDQMLAQSTRQYYQQREEGYQEYENYLRKHRKEMASLVNRMIAGRVFGEVETQTADDGTIRCRLRKKLRRHFEYKEVLMVKEGRDLKLLTIR